MKTVKSLNKKVLLVILDGFGINNNRNKNAIYDANTPNLDYLFKHYPFTTIESGGESVGLPKGVVGNSEVGHMNLGAGRPVRQDLVRINEAIANHTLQGMNKLKELIQIAQKNSGRIHLMGLLSDGGVHSHIDHIKEVISLLSKEKVELFFHAFMDGRDTPKTNGPKYIQDLSTVEGFKFASMQGRSIGMDRDRRWEKIQAAYEMMTGKGAITTLSPLDYIQKQYEQEIYDEFISPALFSKDYAIKEGDCVFFLNFRPDRAIQITLAFNDPDFKEFKRDFIPPYYLCMTPYVPDELDLPILFDKEKISGTMSEFLSKQGIQQFKIAETEKYAHVTFFFNGGYKEPFKGEVQKLIPSPKEVSTYDQKPEMSAPLVTQELLTALDQDQYSFWLVNFANSDMVGHTGNYEAAVKAIEVLDGCVKKLMDKCEKNHITMLLTADHGNSDQMVYEDGSPHTSHTGAPVPLALFDPRLLDQDSLVNEGHFALKDVSPTVLYLMGKDLPDSFTGSSIFK